MRKRPRSASSASDQKSVSYPVGQVTNKSATNNWFSTECPGRVSSALMAFMKCEESHLCQMPIHVQVMKDGSILRSCAKKVHTKAKLISSYSRHIAGGSTNCRRTSQERKSSINGLLTDEESNGRNAHFASHSNGTDMVEVQAIPTKSELEVAPQIAAQAQPFARYR